MKTFWTFIFLFISTASYSQDRLTQVLEDQAVSWAAISEIKINLEDERVYSEQFINWDYNWVSAIKVDMASHPNYPPDKFFSHLLVANLNSGKQKLYSLETNEVLDFSDLRKQLVSYDTVFYGDGVRFEIWRNELPVERLFDYFVLRQLWYYNKESHTFHNYLLGIIPVHVHSDYPDGTEPIHRRLGWIPFSLEGAKQIEINDPNLIWIKKAIGYSYFSDWEMKKGDTPSFIKEYFFELPSQGIINVSPSPSELNIPLHPPLTDEYMDKVMMEGKTCVIFHTYIAYQDILRFINEPSSKKIKEVVGLTVSQFFYIDRQTMQLGSHLEIIGPLVHGYANDYDPEYPWENLIHVPAYFIFNPTNNKQ